MDSPGPKLSVIVPVYNERESLAPLYEQLEKALEGDTYEIIFVNDGSWDGSAQALDTIQAANPRVRVIHFRRNFGKAAALAAGFKLSNGEMVITLDADLQDDPAEIPRLVATLEEGYDLVSGWKKGRKDPLSKTIPSRFFNWTTSRLTGIPLKDFNSGFKAYRRPVLEHLDLYGELHRFIPAMVYWKGFRVTEIPVVHHPRRWGKSKYGAWRFLAGFLDLMTILFLTRFRHRPLHVFGVLGLLSAVSGLVINAYLTWVWLRGESIGNRPLLMLGVLLMVIGIQFFSIGLLAEMLTLASSRQSDEGPAQRVSGAPASDHSEVAR
ncbi:MAG: glycosyltransferase family 2 protein [Dehalococcoidia bacterium]|nr:glycosyltransferase family 2 protein [Dehalococcoidia bacterium]